MNDPPRTLRRDLAARRSSAAPTETVPAAAAPSSSRRRNRRAYVLAGVAAIALFVYQGQQRRPIGPSAGVLEVRILASAVPPTEPARVKLGTYNIHGGKGTDGRRDLARIADMLRGLDFAGLNEAHGPWPWRRDDQATELGRMLRLTPLYAPTEERWWSLRFGNGLLTRLDVESWQVVPLERRYGKSYRNLVHVRARAANGTPLNLVVTHVDRSDDRERHEQLRTVGQFFLSLTPPAVLMGDLNSDAADREMQRLLDAPGVVDALGAKLGLKAPRHIDWILVRGAEVADAGLTPAGPSDHPHVWAELTIPPRN